MTKPQATLVAHSGAFKVPEAEVFAVPTPPPTRTHFPIPHQHFIEQVYHQAHKSGLTIVRREFALTKDGARLFGVLTCQELDSQFGMAIGLRNSHDKSMSAGLAAGMKVFICDNLSMWAQEVIRRKHSRFISRDLPRLIMELMARILVLGERQKGIVANMRQRQLQPAQASHIMIEAVRKGAMPASKIGKVAEEWNEPRHEEFEERNCWSLLNCFTQINKERSPEAQLSTDLMVLFVSMIPALMRGVRQ